MCRLRNEMNSMAGLVDFLVGHPETSIRTVWRDWYLFCRHRTCLVWVKLLKKERIDTLFDVLKQFWSGSVFMIGGEVKMMKWWERRRTIGNPKKHSISARKFSLAAKKFPSMTSLLFNVLRNRERRNSRFVAPKTCSLPRNWWFRKTYCESQFNMPSFLTSSTFGSDNAIIKKRRALGSCFADIACKQKRTQKLQVHQRWRNLNLTRWRILSEEYFYDISWREHSRQWEERWKE
jgi:hypothetical protein